MARRMTAKYRGSCIRCGGPVNIGDDIDWIGRGTVRHHVCEPVPQLHTHNLDEEFIRWLGKTIMEEGSPEAAWSLICQLNEHWDGEDAPRAAERAKFDAHLPMALRQNELIHG